MPHVDMLSLFPLYGKVTRSFGVLPKDLNSELLR